MRHGKAKQIARVILDHLGVISMGSHPTRCLDCNIVLLPGFNFTRGCQRKYFYICADCNTGRKRGWRGRAS